jgi:hypothetical protein
MVEDLKPEGNSLKKVVAVEKRVNDELNLLVVNPVDEAPNVGDSVKELENTMATVELECTIVTCNLGPGGTWWKGPALPLASALRYRDFHIQDNDHGVEEVFVTSMVMEEERKPVLHSKPTDDRIVLECSNAGCQLGPGGTRWSTPSQPVPAATGSVVDHRLTHHLVYEDYPGAEGEWIMSYPEVR